MKFILGTKPGSKFVACNGCCGPSKCSGKHSVKPEERKLDNRIVVPRKKKRKIFHCLPVFVIGDLAAWGGLTAWGELPAR